MAILKAQTEDTTKTFRDLAVANPNSSATRGEVDNLRLSIDRLELRLEQLELRLLQYGAS